MKRFLYIAVLAAIAGCTEARPDMKEVFPWGTTTIVKAPNGKLFAVRSRNTGLYDIDPVMIDTTLVAKNAGDKP